jgi:hypothetical protein
MRARSREGASLGYFATKHISKDSMSSLMHQYYKFYFASWQQVRKTR